jgi:hypothetical protein
MCSVLKPVAKIFFIITFFFIDQATPEIVLGFTLLTSMCNYSYWQYENLGTGRMAQGLPSIDLI